MTDQFALTEDQLAIQDMARKFTADGITQVLVASGAGPEKRETLRRLIRKADGFKNAIIFCNRKREVALLHKSLQTHGFSAGALHGDLDQRSRMAALDAFRNGELDLLVCSDVAARGLDIPDVSHVFNFDVPTHAEDYVHRIGRTGRAGKSGTAISIVTGADRRYVDDIEKLIQKTIDWSGPTSAPESDGADASVAAEPRAPGGRQRRERGAGRGRERDAAARTESTPSRGGEARAPRGGSSGRAEGELRAPRAARSESPAPRRDPAPRREPSPRPETALRSTAPQQTDRRPARDVEARRARRRRPRRSCADVPVAPRQSAPEPARADRDRSVARLKSARTREPAGTVVSRGSAGVRNAQSAVSRAAASTGVIATLSPQPQADVWFGLLKTKRA